MSYPIDEQYFLRRAREERRKAETCEDNARALALLDRAEVFERCARTMAAEAIRVAPAA